MEANLSRSPKPHNLIDFNSAQEIPDSHIWEHIKDDVSDAGDALITPESLPSLIDLNDPNVMELVRNACKTWGMFQITNHGIPISLIEDIERAVNSLFALPLEQKLKAARAPGMMSSGYSQSNYSSIVPKLLWYESFTIFGSPREHAQKLWPHDYNKFCDVVEKYEEKMKMLTDRLMCLILGSLGISKDDIEWVSSEIELTQKAPPVGLLLNFYPACPEPNRAMGLMAHTDSAIFNILYQNQVSGLQIQPKKNGWITVPHVPNAFVINVGDILHVLSNGLYPSVLHRVMVNRTKNRFSVTYVHVTPNNGVVSPHPKLVDSTHPALYRSVSWMEYRAIKGKLVNKALATLRVDYKEE